MKIITMYNNKGGVGKSTSVINIAYCMQKQGLKVLVIDCDGQGNSSRFFTDNTSKRGIESCFINSDEQLSEYIQKTRYENISIITASTTMNNAVSEFQQLSTSDQLSNVHKLKSSWNSSQIMPDYVIIDLPPALNSLTASILSECDYVFVPIELSTFAIQGVPTVTETIANAGSHFGGCFVSKFDKDNPSDIALRDMLRTTLGTKALNSIIPFSRVIKNSISFRVTASEYMDWTGAADSYTTLTNEIRSICE